MEAVFGGDFMQQKDLLKEFKNIKFIQLILLIGIEIVFFLVLILNSQLCNSVFTNKNLFLLAAMMWGLMIFSLIVVLYDFYKLKTFAEQNHALNKAAYLDNLTGIPNRYSCDLMFNLYSTEESIKDIGCCLLTISNLPHINDNFDHSIGDKTIKIFCDLLEQVGDRFGFVGRNGGNEFLSIIDNCDENTMSNFIEVLNQNIADYNKSTDSAKIEFNFAYILNSAENVHRFSDLITLTYKKLNLH